MEPLRTHHLNHAPPVGPSTSGGSPASDQAAGRTRTPQSSLNMPVDGVLPLRPGPVRTRLGLQQRASGNLRRHMLRAIRRVTVLVIADLASFGIMRALLRSVRDHGLLGQGPADLLQTILPTGILSGWQFAVALLVSLLVTGNYGYGDRRRSLPQLFLACALATALPLWMRIWSSGLDVVLLQYVLTTVLVWIGVTAERLTIDRIVARALPAAHQAARTLFVGTAEECRNAMATRAFTAANEFHPIGFVDTRMPPAPEARGHLSDYSAVLHASRAEAVVVVGSLSEAGFKGVVESALAAGCQVLTMPRTTGIAGVQPSLVWRRNQPLIEFTVPSLKAWQLLLKRVVDLAGATVGLVVAGPLMLLIAVLIKLDSPGPVFFRQIRIGTGGTRFRVWKFRTMRHGASDAAHRALIDQMMNGDEAGAGHAATNGDRVYKLVHDDRVTRVGRWLRRTSLDELAQLFNVLRGEMSLVGPRPPLVYEFEAYDHWQFDRLRVKPGITGLWQVSGRNLLTYRQMCELDLEYVRRWSLWLDLKILGRTLPVVLFNSGRAA